MRLCVCVSVVRKKKRKEKRGQTNKTFWKRSVLFPFPGEVTRNISCRLGVKNTQTAYLQNAEIHSTNVCTDMTPN